MSKLKIITSVGMCKLLEKNGFFFVRQKGSHRIYKHADGRVTIVPMHSKDLVRSLIRQILVEIGMSIDEYNNNV